MNKTKNIFNKKKEKDKENMSLVTYKIKYNPIIFHINTLN